MIGNLIPASYVGINLSKLKDIIHSSFSQYEMVKETSCLGSALLNIMKTTTHVC
jgi:hypothetical protein